MTRQERLNTPPEQMGRVRLNEYIKRRLKEEGISAYRLAQILGISKQNLWSFLAGRITAPIERIETILWILDGDDLKVK